MVHHIQTKIWFTYNTNNYDMVTIKRLTLKKDKVLKILVKNASYNIVIWFFGGKIPSRQKNEM
jgi:hypothetical protein